MLDQIKRGDMPPPKVKKSAAKVKKPATRELVDAERQLLVTWISATLQAAEQAKRNSEGRVLMRRLTRYEYANTMRDLLGIDFDFARDLPPEPASPDGFLNDGATLEMSSTQIESYLSAARQALQIAIVSGDQPEVHRYHATETAVGKLPRKKEGGHLPVNPEFLLDIPKFPRRGTFRLVIRAAAVIPPGEDYPRLQVSLGNVPGIIHVPRKRLGEVDVTAPIDAPQTFVFEGRLEDFPQPGDREFGANVDFNGMIALIDFVDADGNELRYGDRSYSDPPPKQTAKGKQKSSPRTGRAVPEDGPRYDIIVESVEFEAPYFKAWPPASHQRLLAHLPDGKTETQRLREILVRFMTRAFRRPVAERELSQTMELFASIRPQLDSFEAAVRETLASVLVSPHFLYIVDQQRSSEAGDSARLTEFELATRLSYFLWSTMPDQTLRELAAAGTLSQPQVLGRQLQRMLDDPQALELVNHFSDQWFGLDTLDRVAVNPEFYPEFDNDLKAAMRAETRGFVREILAHNDKLLGIDSIRLDDRQPVTGEALFARLCAAFFAICAS